MRTVRVYRAQPIGELDVLPITIEIGVPLPDEVRGEGLQHLMQIDAHRVAAALLHALPGGTIDRVLIRLLESRLGMLRVPYEIIPAAHLAAPEQAPIAREPPRKAPELDDEIIF